jgi:DNA-binding transcriptional LysR family regulator
MIEAARAALADFDARWRGRGAWRAGQVGAIVTAIASSSMLSDLPIALQRFRSTYPDVTVTLRDMHSAEQSWRCGAG